MSPVATLEELFDREFHGWCAPSASRSERMTQPTPCRTRSSPPTAAGRASVGTTTRPAGCDEFALNRLLNRRRDRRRHVGILEGVLAVDDSMLDESLLDLRREVQQLPPRMRAAVCLHYLADLSTAEVAAALGISVGTVKSSLHDARRRLRVSLEVTDD